MSPDMQFNCQGMRKWLFDNQDKWWLPKQTDKTFLLNVDWQGWHLFSEVRILEVQTSLVQALRHGCIDLVYVSAFHSCMHHAARIAYSLTASATPSPSTAVYVCMFISAAARDYAGTPAYVA